VDLESVRTRIAMILESRDIQRSMTIGLFDCWISPHQTHRLTQPCVVLIDRERYRYVSNQPRVDLPVEPHTSSINCHTQTVIISAGLGIGGDITACICYDRFESSSPRFECCEKPRVYLQHWLDFG
jgi:hypothetical protein